MAYEIEVMVLDPQETLVIEAQCAPTEIAQTLGSVFGRVYEHIVSRGGEVRGAPFLRYLGMGDRFHFEAGMPNPGGVAGEGEVIARTLPGGRTATTLYLGEYGGVGEAWSAMYAWAAEEGIGQQLGGWDVYENDPDSVADPSELRTRLYLPLS